MILKFIPFLLAVALIRCTGSDLNDSQGRERLRSDEAKSPKPGAAKQAAESGKTSDQKTEVNSAPKIGKSPAAEDETAKAEKDGSATEPESLSEEPENEEPKAGQEGETVRIKALVNYLEPPAYEYPADYNPSADPALTPDKFLLVWLDKPATEVVINWGTEGFTPGGMHTVWLAEKPFFGKDPASNYPVKLSAKESGMANTCGSGRYANLQAVAGNLKPDTTYFFIVESNGYKSKEMHFVTAPDNAATGFSLLSGGDSRSDREKRREMNREVRSLTEGNHNYLALVHGGDFVADGDDCDDWQGWRQDHQETLTATGRILPVVPTFGNHESGGEVKYQALLSAPEKNPGFYFHSRIGMLDLLILNSEISVEGDQREWLDETLSSVNQKREGFLIAGYHRPAMPAVKSPGSTISWVPLFESHQTDLVLESDGHSLKQTCPVYAGACDPEKGVIYVGEGGLGVPQRSPANSNAWYFEGGYALSQHHVQTLDFIPSENPSDRMMRYQVYFDNSMNFPLTFKIKDSVNAL